MGIADLIPDFFSTFAITEAHAEAPSEEQDESSEENGDEGKGDESSEAKEDAEDDTTDDGGEEEEEEEEEPEDVKPKLEEGKFVPVTHAFCARIHETQSFPDLQLTSSLFAECANSKQCAPFKHHFDECVERVTEALEHADNKKGPHEDCVEECEYYR
jgi:ubiquinol-cytochrome c reductase subunit 6